VPTNEDPETPSEIAGARSEVGSVFFTPLPEPAPAQPPRAQDVIPE
jgi:hypothetical protein